MVKVPFDHNMPPAIARALHEIVSLEGHEACALRDIFSANITDVEFFQQLGKEKDWVVISKDTAQAKRPPEREAILRYGIVVLYLAPSVEKLPPHQQAATILWQWEAILRQRATQMNGLFQLPINKRSKFRSL